jgi:hypothetical protein
VRIHPTLLAALCAALLLSSCDRHGNITVVAELNPTFDFESGMEGWSAEGVDLTGPDVTWAVGRSTEEASSGVGSARFWMDNANGRGKIWIEQGFDVAPNRSYDVHITLDLASADFGQVVPWRIIAGVHPGDSEDSEATEITVQDSTLNGVASDQGMVWNEHHYVERATSDADGRLVVTLGIWGTTSGTRVYYVDNLRLEFWRVWAS